MLSPDNLHKAVALKLLNGTVVRLVAALVLNVAEIGLEVMLRAN